MREHEAFKDVNPSQIRLREKTTDKLTADYHEECIMEKYTMKDGKEVAIQILSPEEHAIEISLGVEKENCNLVMVKLWSPDTWDLSETHEIYIPKDKTLEDFG